MSHDRATIKPGASFGRYDVISLLGRGGMGAVYKARDGRLQRDVALKVIHARDGGDRISRRRFDSESRSVARLSHPNIVSVFDVGEERGTPYMVSELVGGGTLSDRLGRGAVSMDEALPLAIAIAEGLAEAHRHGIVHRDLKPSNVLLTSAGAPKIADFGLSKLLEPVPDVDEKESTHVLTRDGAIVGTPVYMSPEQAEGREIDFRSDQFSFGSMLVEMLTQRRPFDRATQVRTLAAIVSEPPDLAPLARVAPEGVLAIVRRCLAKEPSQRYASTDDLVRELRSLNAPAVARPPRVSRRRVAAIILAATVALALGAFLWSRRATPPATRKIESLAILPLSNFSGDQQNDYFADAMTEELTSQLAAVHSLRVASRTSASAYRDTKKPLSTVARELGVDGVIEGSVVRRGDRARITVQLIDGASDRHVWSESFERDGADIMILQRDIAREIVERVRATLSPAEQAQMARVPTRNNEAYDAYLHATYKQKTALQSRADADEAIRYAERAVALDPAFAEAWVTLAYACQLQMFQWKGGKEYDEKAFIAVQKALALNPSLAEAYIIRGVLNYNQWHAYDIGATIVDYRRAIALNPNLADAHQNLGSELTHLGLHDQGIAAFRTALRLDPQLGAAKMRLARALWQSNRFEEARDVYERYDISTFERAVTLGYLGRYDDAWKIARNPDSPTYKYDFGAVRAFLHALRGEAQQAEGEIKRAASEGAGVAHFHHAACILAAADAELGNADRAVRWLEVAASTGMPNYPLFRDNPSLRKLRGNARYEKFLADLRPRWEQIVSQAR